MILVRAPLRISFVGGGSDLPSFGEPGYTVSATIAQSVYVSLAPTHDGRTRLHYKQIEDVDAPHWLQHDRARAALAASGVPGGVELHSMADVPAGTGLGSSSAFTVATLIACAAYTGASLTPARAAALACHVEIDLCGHPIGRQDQYASAFGGLRAYTFPAGTSELLPVPAGLESLLSLLPVGGTHDASQILRTLAGSAKDGTRQMVSLAHDFAASLCANDLDMCGEILKDAWKIKRRLAPGITTPAIDAAVEHAYAHGARGVKLLGAGGAGYLLCWGGSVPGAEPVKLAPHGAQVVYDSGARLWRTPLVCKYAGGHL